MLGGVLVSIGAALQKAIGKRARRSKEIICGISQLDFNSDYSII